MLRVSSVDLYPDSQEERLPGFTPQFPHLCSCSLLGSYPQRTAPWHWHRSAELFYVQRGAVLYQTPGGERLFRAGSGGMVNCNVLHKTRALEAETEEVLHLFEPELIAGIPGGTVEQEYVAPLRDAPGLELIPLTPEEPQQAETLRLLCESLALDETAYGYELQVQAMLCTLWLRLARQVRPALPQAEADGRMGGTAGEKIKPMMLYIHAHIAEKLSVGELAAAGFCSERACYRVFREALHTTPADYIQGVRLQMACKLLIETNLPLTTVAQQCGLGSSSYFGAQFRAEMGCTPTEYRKHWQDIDTTWHNVDSTLGSDEVS